MAPLDDDDDGNDDVVNQPVQTAPHPPRGTKDSPYRYYDADSALRGRERAR